jgi:lipooligosaccharide transport system permease protein
MSATLRLDIGYRVLHVWRRHMRVWLRYWISNLITNFIEPFVYLVGLGFGIGHFVPRIAGAPYATFVAPGIIASASMFAASFESTFGTYVRLVYQKTFDAIIATPVSADEVSAGDLLYSATKSTLFSAVILIALIATRLVPHPLATSVLVPVATALTGFVFGALGMIVSALVPNIDNFNYYITLFLTPMFVFSGVFYPVATLPRFAQDIAWFTPLYHTVDLCRGLVLGGITGAAAAADFLWLLIVALLLFPVPVLLMRKRLIQ